MDVSDIEASTKGCILRTENILVIAEVVVIVVVIVVVVVVVIVVTVVVVVVVVVVVIVVNVWCLTQTPHPPATVTISC